MMSAQDERDTVNDTKLLDIIVIGAGISGIIFLKYACEQGLHCVALEKQDEVGGLWTWLPAWQDIQNRKEDFAINDIPLEGAKQPDVLQHVRTWVQEYNLTDRIKLQCEVTSIRRTDKVWHVITNQEIFRANYVIVATGVQNEPWIPDLDRSHSNIKEVHSSRLHQPKNLHEQRVTVVGGGTSSWDLLDLAIENGAKDIHWVHRGIHWFQPTSGTKQSLFPNLRMLAIAQSVMQSTERVNGFLRWMLEKLYHYFQVEDLEPAEPFDIRKDQLVPGRSVMIQNLDAISRHQSEVRSVQDRKITLENEECFETDMLLWGTGYRMNLSYLNLPEYNQITTLDELLPRLGSLIRSIDYPNLFFIGMSLVGSTSSTPFFIGVEAKSIIAHILGQCNIPKKNIPHHINHWNLFKYFASFDHANYPRFWWRIKYFLLAWWYGVFRNKSIKV